MPELPEVETIKNTLQSAVGAVVQAIEIRRQDYVRRADYDPAGLSGGNIASVTRRGKYLVVHFHNDQYLIIHLGMSGRVFLSSEVDVPGLSHVHVVIHLSDHRQILLQDPRRFGGIWFVREPGVVFSHMGLEPLSSSFNVRYLTQIVQNRRVAIKTLLLNQNMISGIGNIYADEALFSARILPTRMAGSLNNHEIRILVRSIKKVLRAGIEQRGTTLRDYRDSDNRPGGFQNYLQVYGRHQQACHRCGQPIQRQVINQRSSHFCSVCQK